MNPANHTARVHLGPLLATATLVLALPAPALAGVGLRPLAASAPLDGPADCGSREPELAALASGGFAAVWTDGTSLWLRRLDGGGRPAGAAEVVAIGAPMAPEVAGLPGGGLAVVWFDAAREQILARRAGPDLALGAELVLGVSAPERGQGFGGLDVSVRTDGGVVVGWVDYAAALLREWRPEGDLVPAAAPYLVEASGGVTGFDPAYFDPAVLAGPDGSIRMFWVSAGAFFGDYQEEGSIEGRWLRGLDEELRHEIVVPGFGRALAAAMAADGSYLLAWKGVLGLDSQVTPIHRSAVLAARFTPADVTGGEPEIVDEGMVSYGQRTAVAPLPDGRYVVGWSAALAVEPDRPLALARTVDAAGIPRALAAQLAPPESWGQAAPDLAPGAGGLVLATWQEVQDPDVVFVTCPGEQVRARPFQVLCPGGGTVCLGGGRFELALSYSDPRRGIPVQLAQGAQLTPDTGYFWFTTADNAEVVAKVLDARQLNGHFWVFYGGLTDLGFVLEVIDTETGNRRVYTNAPGELASAGDTEALPGGPPPVTGEGASPVQLRAFSSLTLDRAAFPAGGRALGPERQGRGPSLAPAADPSEVDSAAGPCSPPELPVVPRPGLCLNGRRFEVEVDWRAFDGTTGVGHGVPLGDDSGYFWFFSPDNVELLLKVLDARGINGHFWVFYGALSNVEYDIVVRHVSGQPAAEYHNPAGHFASVADVEALLVP
jgi:hypothetical protein